jgi:hypothetical protein
VRRARPHEVEAIDHYQAERFGGDYNNTRSFEAEGAPGEWHNTCPVCGDLMKITPGADEPYECRLRCNPEAIRGFLHADPLPSTSPSIAAEKPVWPDRPSQTAFHGLAGRAIKMIGPHTEADATALLVQLLVAFGNAAGRGPGWRVGADAHHLNLYVALVGDTATGRKGTSWAEVRRVFELAEPEWVRERVRSGLSSGEGLIHHVRDDLVTRRKARTKAEKQEADGDGFIEDVEPGVDDKRLLAFQGELGQTFKVMAREGNPLSPILRDMWDHGNAGNLTKNQPEKTTGAHVSMVGHITATELEQSLDQVERANGFANRFLFICTRRARSLPFGGSLADADLEPLGHAFRDALEFARGQGVLDMDAEARAAWEQVYEPLTERPDGMLGAITGRAVPIVRRLAVIYALLDSESIVRLVHLQAALALWDYSERSAAHIFGATIGDRTADRLLRHLADAGTEGLARSDIRSLLGGRIEAHNIDRALGELRARGLARDRRISTGGRPEERWFAAHSRNGGDKPGSVEETPRPLTSLHETPLPSTPRILGEDQLAEALIRDFDAVEIETAV